jgi:hypothetical protein
LNRNALRLVGRLRGIEASDQSRPLPDLALQSVSLELVCLLDRAGIVRGFDPVRGADAARTVQTVEPIRGHLTPETAAFTNPNAKLRLACSRGVTITLVSFEAVT